MAKPTLKPTDKPTEKPVAKPTSKPTEKPVAPESPSQCSGIYKIAQRWQGPGLEPDGTKVDNVVDLSNRQGVRLPYAQEVYMEADRDQEVAFDVQLCERLNDGGYWHCAGTYINLFGCHGKLSFSGFHEDSEATGHYVITGGTGAFLGAKGDIYEEYDSEAYYVRTITISY